MCLQQLPGAQRLAVGVGGDALLLKWLLLVIGKLCENNVEVWACGGGCMCFFFCAGEVLRVRVLCVLCVSCVVVLLYCI